ncbi:NADH-quinone oxidoreductase subunit K [Falsiroseomonas oryziterrae]|uniref:NADH-quinone oxidoreductase subunit K n=1 Tax=Falsiroseomonas oryziterrae TaxID=2911368 RepID=UPI001F3D64FA|nr:NADH-quinone oxidoreductase subunit K [Roseomonas sp. NPKOSM-4]
METAFALTIGVLVGAAAYLLLARDLPRALLGFVLLGTAANLSIFAAGRTGTMVPPLVAPGAEALATDAANPLPQALVLTAIVIGFGLAAFALVLVMRAHAEFGSASAEDMDEAERPDDVAAPAAPALNPAAERKEAA